MLGMYKSTWTVEDVNAKEVYDLSIYHFGKTPVLRWYGIKNDYYTPHIIEYTLTRPLGIKEILDGFLKCLTHHWKVQFLYKKKR